jgi:hopene-associated glycosyltransferase HpnB
VRAKQRESGAALVSVMARLRMESAWERLLIPAFVYFFKLLYPFRLSNGPGRWVAAGAGGCMLVERSALEAIGGFAAVRGALIDDCALARAIKGSGRRIWIGLSHGVTSHRPYRGLGPIWEMVARTAYTQLGTSPKLLLACTAVMLLAFWAPLAGALFGAGAPRTVAALGLAAMALSYQPVLRFYRRSPAWAAALPLIGTLYLAMTWDSALRCWRGERSRWKGRSYAARDELRRGAGASRSRLRRRAQASMSLQIETAQSSALRLISAVGSGESPLAPLIGMILPSASS